MFWSRWNLKYYLGIIGVYTVMLTIAIGCIFIETDRVGKQLVFYKNSGYQYVYEATGATGENDYLNCSSVYFYTDREMSKSLLGDCFMLLDNSTYNSVSPINPNKKLGCREIAVAYNLARQHHLDVGSKVYSKHNIENRIEEYTVAEILPISYGVLQVDTGINYSLILIGDDKKYIENTDYTFVGFSSGDPSTLIQSSGAGLISLNQKNTVERQLMSKALLWQSTILVMVLFLTLLYVVVHWKYQRNYYSRLTMSGCPAQKLKKQIMLDIAVPGTVGLLAAFILSTVILSINNLYFSFSSPLISAVVGWLVLIVLMWVTAQKGGRM